MKHKSIILIAVICAVLILAAVVIAVCMILPDRTPAEETEDSGTLPEQPFEELSLGSGIVVTKVFPYTGIYVEDGTDTPVIGVAACTVENTGTAEVQLLDFTVASADGPAYTFEVTTLLPGQKMTVLDGSRTPYCNPAGAYTARTGAFAVFRTTPSLEADKVQVICSGSTLKVTNLTDTPMKTCRVYFKYKQNDTYIGGVTFSVKLTDLQPGTPATVTSSHYNEGSCEIMFVTYE